jgi:hypothetical protein
MEIWGAMITLNDASKHEWEVKWKNLGSDCLLNRADL